MRNNKEDLEMRRRTKKPRRILTRRNQYHTQ
jgi:hypothetical protein